MHTSNGSIAKTFNQISQLCISHFKQPYKEPPASNLADIIQVAGHFPSFVDLKEIIELISHATRDALEGTLRWFQKDKSLGLDGCPIEFYWVFFSLNRIDLLNVVEEFQTFGKMYEAINATFIALIPKSDSHVSFNDFWPISLYNTLYKIIAKIIAN